MNWQKIISVAAAVCTLLAGSDTSLGEKQGSSQSVPNVVTKDIQKGIEKHIEEQSRLGEGYFKLPFDEEELRLKLVRVHTEYLANLGPRRHFACVDLANIDGDVYDVDFFLAGDPGAMNVTETTIHKVNGQPRYVWEQKRDKTWHRVTAKGAPPELLGVITGRDEFEFIYRATLPELTDNTRMWIHITARRILQFYPTRHYIQPSRQAKTQ